MVKLHTTLGSKKGEILCKNELETGKNVAIIWWDI
jgi:hypothetical protein